MALKITLTVGKKLGTANYGSLSATCGVEFEADSGLLPGDAAAFHDRVARAYAACRTAVEQELARQQAVPAGSTAAEPAPRNARQAEPAAADSGRGRRAAVGPSEAPPNGGNGRGATEKQLGYARQLAKQISGLGVRRLDWLAGKMYGKPLAALSSMDASGLIDTLKSVKAGEVDLDAALQGGAP